MLQWFVLVGAGRCVCVCVCVCVCLGSRLSSDIRFYFGVPLCVLFVCLFVHCYDCHFPLFGGGTHTHQSPYSSLSAGWYSHGEDSLRDCPTTTSDGHCPCTTGDGYSSTSCCGGSTTAYSRDSDLPVRPCVT